MLSLPINVLDDKDLPIETFPKVLRQDAQVLCQRHPRSLILYTHATRYVSAGLRAMLGKHMEGKHMAVVAARAA